MLMLMSWRVWVAIAIAAALAFSHFTAYRSGKNHVTLQWKASIAQANIDARETERLRQRSVDKAVDAAAAREIGLRADAARAAGLARGLRDDLAALKSRSQSGTAADPVVSTVSELFASCVDEYQRVATEADRATSEVKTLRDAWPK